MKSKIKLRLLLSVASALLCSTMNVVATQEYRVKDGDTITIKLSSHDLTRIAIEGGRLDKVWGVPGQAEITPDKDKGEAFVRASPGAPAAISFFARDDMGSTYTIVAQQFDVPSETVILKPMSAKKSKDQSATYKSVPLVESIKRLMKAMATDVVLDGYISDSVNVDVKLWKETKITLQKSYSSKELLGEVYQVKNVSGNTMNFQEREFLDFGSHVQAVALEVLELANGESTLLFIVRRNEAN